MDKTNCSVNVFNVLCSACFGTEWNIREKLTCFSRQISITPPPPSPAICNITNTHTYTHAHSHIYLHCEVNHAENIKTVTSDGWSDERWTFVFSSHHPILNTFPSSSSFPRFTRPPITYRTFEFPRSHQTSICAGVRRRRRTWQLAGDAGVFISTISTTHSCILTLLLVLWENSRFFSWKCVHFCPHRHNQGLQQYDSWDLEKEKFKITKTLNLLQISKNPVLKNSNDRFTAKYLTHRKVLTCLLNYSLFFQRKTNELRFYSLLVCGLMTGWIWLD